MKKSINLVSVVALTLAVMASIGMYGAAEFDKRVDLPAEYSFTIQTTGCTASPGPQVTVQSQMILTGLTTDLILRHPQGGDPQQSVVVQEIVIPDNQPVSVPDRQIVAPVSNDPFIWVQLTDDRGKPLTSEMFLGQCSQGTFNVTTDAPIAALASGEVLTNACDDPIGPAVLLGAAAELDAVHAKLIFRSDSGVSKKGDEVDLVLLQAGQFFELPQQAVMNAGGRNPQVGIQLREGAGQELVPEIRLGRCVANTN